MVDIFQVTYFFKFFFQAQQHHSCRKGVFKRIDMTVKVLCQCFTSSNLNEIVMSYY